MDKTIINELNLIEHTEQLLSYEFILIASEQRNWVYNANLKLSNPYIFATQ